MDSESKGIRNEPPKSLIVNLNLDGSILISRKEINSEDFRKTLKNGFERSGSSFILILEVDKDIKMKDLYKVFTIAYESKIKYFAFVVQEKNGFKNYRHFQIVSKKLSKIEQKEEGDIYFSDSSLTVQDIVRKISLEKDKFHKYSYYIAFEKLEND